MSWHKTIRARDDAVAEREGRQPRRLGAILAGGQSRRFGRDKAHALLDGARLIDRVATALGRQCDALVVCGRREAGFACLPDSPQAGLGPLGGLRAALAHARAQGFDEVMSCACDIPDLPLDMARRLGDERAAFDAAVVADQPLVALWSTSLLDALDAYLAAGKRSVHGFVEAVGARRVALEEPLGNINAPAQLEARAAQTAKGD